MRFSNARFEQAKNRMQERRVQFMQGDKKPRGRPKLHPEQDGALSTYSVRLTAFQARMARWIGGGCLSEGIRKAIDFVVHNSTFGKKD
jgi:hypothetical protein